MTTHIKIALNFSPPSTQSLRLHLLHRGPSHGNEHRRPRQRDRGQGGLPAAAVAGRAWDGRIQQTMIVGLRAFT